MSCSPNIGECPNRAMTLLTLAGRSAEGSDIGSIISRPRSDSQETTFCLLSVITRYSEAYRVKSAECPTSVQVVVARFECLKKGSVEAELSVPLLAVTFPIYVSNARNLWYAGGRGAYEP